MRKGPHGKLDGETKERKNRFGMRKKWKIWRNGEEKERERGALLNDIEDSIDTEGNQNWADEGGDPESADEPGDFLAYLEGMRAGERNGARETRRGNRRG